MHGWEAVPKIFCLQVFISQLALLSCRSTSPLLFAVFLRTLFPVPVPASICTPDWPLLLKVLSFTLFPEALNSRKPRAPLPLAVLEPKLLLAAPFSVNPCWLLKVEILPRKTLPVDGQPVPQPAEKPPLTTKPKKFFEVVTFLTMELDTCSKVTPPLKPVMVPGPKICKLEFPPTTPTPALTP